MGTLGPEFLRWLSSSPTAVPEAWPSCWMGSEATVMGCRVPGAGREVGGGVHGVGGGAALGCGEDSWALLVPRRGSGEAEPGCIWGGGGCIFSHHPLPPLRCGGLLAKKKGRCAPPPPQSCGLLVRSNWFDWSPMQGGGGPGAQHPSAHRWVLVYTPAAPTHWGPCRDQGTAAAPGQDLGDFFLGAGSVPGWGDTPVCRQ